MKILILGSGQVGSAIAQELATLRNHDVTVIDTKPEALQKVSSHLDVQTLIGNGASPAVLERAGAEDADMLLALTHSDEINLAACHMAAEFFNIPNRLARVRSSDYSEYADESGHNSLKAFHVTESIHPEQLVTQHLNGLLNYVRALQVLPFADDRVKMVIVQVHAEDDANGRRIDEISEILPSNARCQICMIYRNNRMIVPQGDTVIQEGDEVCFVCASPLLKTIMYSLFHYHQGNHRVMIAGGGNVGFRLAKQLEQQFNIKIIENNLERAEWLAENLDDALVLHGSGTDETLLQREYIDDIDVFCALTNDDENNIMAALLAKNLGAKRVIAIINRSRYVDLLIGHQIDIVVSPHQITIGNVLAHIRRGHIVAVKALRRGKAEAIEAVVHGDKRTSDLVGRRILDIKWPQGCNIAAVVREDEVILGRENPILQDGDHLILFVARRHILRELEKLLQVKMGFFG